MYPVFEGFYLHSAMFVAIIASFHVLASHLTVASAWFNLYLERRAVRENRPELYEYLKRSALGLMVFAYVFGAMAGVGIWQSTTAANPRGISTLIHNFVLYWGSEWYMFMIDVVGIIAYYYSFGRVDKKSHLRLAWLLALGGTGTLSLIVGILAFVLTPGTWLQTGQSLNGFYNPTFWPQWLLRFSMMFAIAGAYAVFIAAGMPKGYWGREQIIRKAGIFGLCGMAVSISVALFWYIPALTDHAREVAASVAVPAGTYHLILGGLVASCLGLCFAVLRPAAQRPRVVLCGMVVLALAIFGAERTREVMRKPDIIAGYMADNQLVFAGHAARGIASEEAALNQTGMLGHLPFLPTADAIRPADGMPNQQVAMGRLLVTQQCSACHSVSPQTALRLPGQSFVLRSQAELLAKRGITTADRIEGFIRGIGGFPYMHPVVGNDEERRAMAVYLEYAVQQQTPALYPAGVYTPNPLAPQVQAVR